MEREGCVFELLIFCHVLFKGKTRGRRRGWMELVAQLDEIFHHPDKKEILHSYVLESVATRVFTAVVCVELTVPEFTCSD